MKLAEVPIYGTGRLGIDFIDESGNQSPYYQLTDHLGNVRAVVGYDVNGTALAVQSYADYYPFGWKMPGRQMTSGEGYRYGYQGEFAEEESDVDNEAASQWNSFELRMYDSRIGRWMTTDPANQYASPYLGMGNNPVNGVDPDGGYWKPEMGEDGSIILIQQEDDNLESLIEYFNGSVDFLEAMKIYNSMDNGRINLSSLGDNNFFFPSMRPFKFMRNFFQRGDRDKLNCHKCTIGFDLALKGQIKNFTELENNESSLFEDALISGFFNYSEEWGTLNQSNHFSESVIPGKSIIMYTSSDDVLPIVRHSAISLGFDNSGKHYVWSKIGTSSVFSVHTTKEVLVNVPYLGIHNLYDNPQLKMYNYGKPLFFINSR